DEIERAGATAEQAEGRLEIAVAENDNLGIFGSDLEYSFDAETAPPLAGAGRVGQIFVVDQPVRSLLLEHLIVLVEHPTGSIDHADMVVAVGAAQRARSTIQPHEADVDIFLVFLRIEARRQRA